MRKSVIFALYGGSNQYLEKFVKNLPTYRQFFWDFDIVLFLEDSMMELDIPEFQEFNVLIFPKKRNSISDGMFWRFEPIISEDFNYDLCLIRDVDYLPSSYEFQFINEFISSDFKFQILRLHYDHMMPIMGGLFGIKSELFKEFRSAYDIWRSKNSMFNIKYNDDQFFLAKYVYKEVFKYSHIVTSNIRFLNENVRIVKMPEDIIVGGDFDRHLIDPIKKNYFVVFPPVFICIFLNFRGLRYLNYRYFIK
jgi:hypothetical protein